MWPYTPPPKAVRRRCLSAEYKLAEEEKKRGDGGPAGGSKKRRRRHILVVRFVFVLYICICSPVIPTHTGQPITHPQPKMTGAQGPPRRLALAHLPHPQGVALAALRAGADAEPSAARALHRALHRAGARARGGRPRTFDPHARDDGPHRPGAPAAERCGIMGTERTRGARIHPSTPHTPSKNKQTQPQPQHQHT